VLNCVTLEFGGGGIVTLDVHPTGFPGTFVLQQQTFRFGVPEPTTLSRFALGLVGLAIRRMAIGSV